MMNQLNISLLKFMINFDEFSQKSDDRLLFLCFLCIYLNLNSSLHISTHKLLSDSLVFTPIISTTSTVIVIPFNSFIKHRPHSESVRNPWTLFVFV